MSPIRTLFLLASLASGCAAIELPSPEGPSLFPASADRGTLTYRKACLTCHGARGDGRGPGAAGLDPPPRDFTRGVYRYRSTATGSLPQTADLERTVLHGLPGTAMAGWRDFLSPQEVSDVVAHLQRFSPRFAGEEVEDPVAVPEPLAFSSDSVALGKKAYLKAQCGKCHGEHGRGDGWAREDEMKDDLGRVVRARDFTRGIYRSGRGKRDLWRVFYTGLDGSPMPAYESTLSPDELYHLVNYLLSLERERGLWYRLTTAPTWYEPAEQQVPR